MPQSPSSSPSGDVAMPSGLPLPATMRKLNREQSREAHRPCWNKRQWTLHSTMQPHQSLRQPLPVRIKAKPRSQGTRSMRRRAYQQAARDLQTAPVLVCGSASSCSCRPWLCLTITTMLMQSSDLTLTGKVARWQPRVRAERAGGIWMAWVQVPQLGPIGVYVFPKTTALAEALPQPGWVQVRGLFTPVRVYATDRDPRCADAAHLTPLLIHAVHITHANYRDAGIWVAPSTLRLGHIRRIVTGNLAHARYQPDICALLPHGCPPTSLIHWNMLTAVMAQVGEQRYIRYLVSFSETVGKIRYRTPHERERRRCGNNERSAGDPGGGQPVR
jgi:hypothetical protein